MRRTPSVPPASHPSSWDLRDLLREALLEALGDDHVALMAAGGDRTDAVVRFDLEGELAALDGHEPGADLDREARRRRGGVRKVDVRAQALLARPVEVRLDELDAGPFAQRHQVAGR